MKVPDNEGTRSIYLTLSNEEKMDAIKETKMAKISDKGHFFVISLSGLAPKGPRPSYLRSSHRDEFPLLTSENW